METKDLIACARAWAQRSEDDREQAHHILDAEADYRSEGAEEADEDKNEADAEHLRAEAAMLVAARDALDAVLLLVAEIDRLKGTENEVAMLRGEVAMLRGEGCEEDGDGACGACLKCAARGWRERNAKDLQIARDVAQQRRATIERVGAVITENGCDCDDPTCTVPGESCEGCGHDPCLACRVSRALTAGGRTS